MAEKELSELTAVHTLLFDVRDKKVSESIALPIAFTIDILINNGNAHGLDPFKLAI
jgi:NADP-dependent 3-hydroxy acid dehydrogenase YdfG